MYYPHTNKTAVRSQELISAAVLRLLQKKAFQQITVTEICKEANVGRKTFYRNFEVKEDIIAYQVDKLCALYQEELRSIPIDDYLKHHFSFLQTHAAYFITLYHNGLHSMVSQTFLTLLPDTMPIWTNDPIVQQYKSQYVIAGVEAIQRVWVERGFQESVEQIVAIVQSLQEHQLPQLE